MPTFRAVRLSDSVIATDPGMVLVHDPAQNAWEPAAQPGGSGAGDVLASVSGSVTLPSTAPTGALYGYRATGTTTFTGVGGSVVLDPGAYVFERTASGWTYRTLDAGTALTGGGGPISVTATAPTFTDDAGTSSDTYTIPSTTGVVYKVSGTVRAAGTYPGSGTVTVTAEAATGYTLTGTSIWTHTFSSGGTPPADTTAPVGASLAVTGSGDAGSTRTLTVSGATDAGSGLHAQPYAFSMNGGSTWSSWQSSPSFTTGNLAAGTYQPRARVRDNAPTPNVATVSAPDFTLAAAPTPDDIWDDFARFTSASYVDLTTQATLPSGQTWVTRHPETSWAANVTTTVTPPCRNQRMDIIGGRHAGVLLTSNHVDASIDFTMISPPAASTWFRFGVGSSTTDFVAAMLEWKSATSTYEWGIWHNTAAGSSSAVVTAPALSGRVRFTYDGTNFTLYQGGAQLLTYSTASAPVLGKYLALGVKGDTSGNCFWDNLTVDYLP